MRFWLSGILHRILKKTQFVNVNYCTLHDLTQNENNGGYHTYTDYGNRIQVGQPNSGITKRNPKSNVLSIPNIREENEKHFCIYSIPPKKTKFPSTTIQIGPFIEGNVNYVVYTKVYVFLF